jgi:hypothetical protein
MLSQSTGTPKVVIRDIQIVAENKQGCDWLVGDIHGMVDVFKLIIAKLGPNDRLFIVGDLVDRGPGSLEVLQMIQAINAQQVTPKIYVVRGNHEEGFLAFYSSYKANSKAKEQLQEAKIQLENIKEEVSQCDSLSARQALDVCTQKYNEAVLFLKDANQSYAEDFHFLRALENNWAVEKTSDGSFNLMLAPSKMAEIAALLSSFPYIIRVEGDKPFNVVHAHMPISQNTLLNRIARGNLYLTMEEMGTATDTKKDFPLGSHSTDAPTYSGHIVFGGLRADTNHINLDMGTFVTGMACLVNHQRKTAELVGVPALAETKYSAPYPHGFMKECAAVKNTIAAHLGNSLSQGYNDANKENRTPHAAHKLKAPKHGALFNKSLKRTLESAFSTVIRMDEQVDATSNGNKRFFQDLTNSLNETIDFINFRSALSASA